MEQKSRSKAKSKKTAAKAKTPKKRKNDGPTCSTFLSELSKKLASKKRAEAEAPRNVIQMIVDSITNALPIKFFRKSPPKKESPMKIETLQTLAPELLPRDAVQILPLHNDHEEGKQVSVEIDTSRTAFKIPKMPVVSSTVFKQAAERRRRRVPTEDAAVNTGGEHDVASEIAKYVGTLKKISLIAEEFNQKTAKNLKEIVDSVREDLIKKMDEMKTEKNVTHSKAIPMHIDELPGAIEEST